MFFTIAGWFDFERRLGDAHGPVHILDVDRESERA